MPFTTQLKTTHNSADSWNVVWGEMLSIWFDIGINTDTDYLVSFQSKQNIITKFVMSQL